MRSFGTGTTPARPIPGSITPCNAAGPLNATKGRRTGLAGPREVNRCPLVRQTRDSRLAVRAVTCAVAAPSAQLARAIVLLQRDWANAQARVASAIVQVRAASASAQDKVISAVA